MSSRVKVLIRNWGFQISSAIIISIVIFGFVGPLFYPNPYAFVGRRYESPSSSFPLGTDILGRDILALLTVGVRNSLIVGFFAGGIGLLIAIALGVFGGYAGGLIDDVLNLLSNVFFVLPTVPLLIIISASVKHRSLLTVASFIAVTIWPWAARQLRAQVLSLKERDFVNLARISGKGNVRIVLEEIIPNMLAYVFTSFCGIFAGAVMSEAGISMIGLGPTTEETLGMMLHWAIMSQAIHLGVWWWFIPPGVVLILFTGALFLLSSVMDDVFNPRVQR
ncbi:MAG: ABC transporter permease [candidate division WOR-3 bacterium]